MLVRSIFASYSRLLAGISLAVLAVALTGCDDKVAPVGARLKGADVQGPAPVGTGGGRRLLAMKAHRDGIGWARGSPDGHRLAALQDGMVAEDRREGEFRGRAAIRKDGGEAGEKGQQSRRGNGAVYAHCIASSWGFGIEGIRANAS